MSSSKKRTRVTKRAEPLAEALDREVEAALKNPGASLSAENRELSELLRVAVELRDLGRREFRGRLGLELRPPLESHDLREATAALRAWDSPGMLGSLDQATIVVTKFAGLAPWERHPAGDALIVVLEGGGEITVLTDDGPVVAELRPGRLFVCPKGLWHRAHAQPAMTALYLTPIAGGEHSFADDPRTA